MGHFKKTSKGLAEWSLNIYLLLLRNSYEDLVQVTAELYLIANVTKLCLVLFQNYQSCFAGIGMIKQKKIRLRAEQRNIFDLKSVKRSTT